MTHQAIDADHPFQAAHLTGWAEPSPSVAAAIQEALDLNRCPRCMGRLPERPRGSKVTGCRCIPICQECRVEEVNPETYLAAGDWPIPLERRLQRKVLRDEAERVLERMGEAPVEPTSGQLYVQPLGEALPEGLMDTSKTPEELGFSSIGFISKPEPKPLPVYTSADCALDALAVLQSIRFKDPGAMLQLWGSIEPTHQPQVVSTLAGWLVTMNQLTAVAFDDWATNIRHAALQMKDNGE